MAKKIKKNSGGKNTDVEPADRKNILREGLLNLLKDPLLIPRKFNINKIVIPGSNKGMLRDFLKGDLKIDDWPTVQEIYSDLEKEGILYHVGGYLWVKK